MPLYQTTGHLTGTIESENVQAAQNYLVYADQDKGTLNHMEQYLDPPLKGVVTDLRWVLNNNGHDYLVVAETTRELSADELKQLSSEVSGQNSDGLGEGFEQQDFAEQHDGECGECYGCENGESCDDDYTGMISFDWQKNELPWTLVS